jgi:hypothetical protein
MHAPALSAPSSTVETTGDSGFHPYCDVAGPVARAQTFTVHTSGTLTSLSYTSMQSGDPIAPLHLRLTDLTAAGLPGRTLASADVPMGEVSWSPSWTTLHSSVPVTSGEQLALVISSPTTRGCYGMAYADSNPYPGGGALYSSDGGTTWRLESGRDLHMTVHLG